MKKVVNLADRKEAFELLKQLYTDKDVEKDGKKGNTERVRGTNSTGVMVDSTPPAK